MELGRPTRRRVLMAAAAVGMAPVLAGCSLPGSSGSSNDGPLIGMEYETWFTCAVGTQPSTANIQTQAAEKLAAIQLATGGSAKLTQYNALQLATLSHDVDGSCSTRPSAGWNTREATPVLGTYESANPAVIKKHAELISGAGVDFLWLDWTNNLGGNWNNGVGLGIMAATYSLAKTYLTLQTHPKFALVLGFDDGQVGTPTFDSQLNMVYDLFIKPPEMRALYQYFLGKPLLGIFGGPNFAQPSFSDPRFTIRWVGGFDEVTHGNLLGRWSWIDRAPQVTYRTVLNSKGVPHQVPEAVTVAAGWPGGGGRATGGWSSQGARHHGQTLLTQWKVAFDAQPEVVLLCQWNEFAEPDQWSPEWSNDMEPTQLNGYGAQGNGGWGTYYLDLTTTMVEAYKAGKPQPQVKLNTSMP